MTHEEYQRTAGTTCYWCGAETPRGPNSVGLDRIDNAVGYVVGNVVPCCFRCNRERNTLTFEEYRLVWLYRRNKASAHAIVAKAGRDAERNAARRARGERTVPQRARAIPGEPAWRTELRRRAVLRELGRDPDRDGEVPPLPAPDEGIERWRRRHGLTQRQAAVYLGINRRSVQKIEHGESGGGGVWRVLARL
jgi:hypothetical protein